MREVKENVFNLTALHRNKQITFCHWVDACNVFSSHVYVYIWAITLCLVFK